MERREHYEPEDIEALLHERGFDELLAEERAFVLRHLSGREEYEAMRALLHRARIDDRDVAPLTADPAIREQLMTTFRERQVPVWRIWLNSVKAFLLPDRASAFWRPALAVAGVLVLVLAGVRIARLAGGGGPAELAAVHEDPAHAHAASGTEESGKSGSLSSATTDRPASNRDAQVDAAQERAIITNGLAELKETLVPTPSPAEQPATKDLDAGYVGPERMVAMDVAADSATSASAANYVEKEALPTTQVLAGTSEAATREKVVTDKGSRDRDVSRDERARMGGDAMAGSRSMAEDGELIELLHAAW